MPEAASSSSSEGCCQQGLENFSKKDATVQCPVITLVVLHAPPGPRTAWVSFFFSKILLLLLPRAWYGPLLFKSINCVIARYWAWMDSSQSKRKMSTCRIKTKLPTRDGEIRRAQICTLWIPSKKREREKWDAADGVCWSTETRRK